MTQGRPFDAPAQAVVLACLKAGSTRTEACERADVATQTFRHALRAGIGDDGQPIEGTFAAAVKDIEVSCLEKIEDELFKAAKKGEPWAVQMWLKGKDRNQWADKPPSINVNTGDTNTIVVQGTGDERRSRVERLALELDNRQRALGPGEPAGRESADAEPEDA